ncbi:MAG: hypothetical protein ACJAXQ_000965, partial [Parvibaculaceae bacterium]
MNTNGWVIPQKTCVMAGGEGRTHLIKDFRVFFEGEKAMGAASGDEKRPAIFSAEVEANPFFIGGGVFAQIYSDIKNVPGATP